MLGRGYGEGYNIIIEGDSFMAASDMDTKIRAYVDNSSCRHFIRNFSVSGSAIGNIRGDNTYMLYSGRYNVVTASRQPVMAKKNILVAHEGINDLNFYMTLGEQSASDAATSCYNNYVSYYGALALLGFKCIFNTTTPRSDVGMAADYELARQNASDKFDTTTLNGKLRTDFNVATSVTRVFKSNLAGWAGCLLYDPGNDPDMGQAGQSTNTIYFNVDGIHINATGNTRFVNNYIGPCIDLVRDNIV